MELNVPKKRLDFNFIYVLTLSIKLSKELELLINIDDQSNLLRNKKGNYIIILNILKVIFPEKKKL